jgi:hypothetical protein
MLVMIMLLLFLDIQGTELAQANEESEGSEDEWNYIKIDDKTAVDHQEESKVLDDINSETKTVESPLCEKEVVADVAFTENKVKIIR